MGLTTPAVSQVARRFPLVARPRPAGQALGIRIAEVENLAREASASGLVSLAAEALNKAALIASDCAMPDMARDVCWRQFTLFERAAPLPAEAAHLAMQPIVNLARLLIRDGHGDIAYQVLDSLYQAARTRSGAVLDGRTIAFSDLTTSASGHRTLCKWLWTVLLGDGLRALVAAGRWDDALACAQHHNGIGDRLLDGRQITVIAACRAADYATALRIVQHSTVATRWEKVVAGCLTVLCLRSDPRQSSAAAATMADDYMHLGSEPGLLSFRTRLGLVVLDLADDEIGPTIGRRLVSEAIAARDGYAARDVLDHAARLSYITEADETALAAVIRASGLGNGAIPATNLDRLQSAINTGEAALARGLMPRGGAASAVSFKGRVDPSPR